MAIALRAAGTWLQGVNSTVHTVPTAQLTGDMMLLIAGVKPYNAAMTVPGWTSLGSGASGTTAAGIDAGSMKCEVFYKVATSDTEANPTLTEGSPAWDVAEGIIVVFSKGAGEEWATPVVVFGGDESDGTSFSVTFGSNPGGTAGDYLALAGVFNSDLFGPLTSDLTVTWTGATIGTYDTAVEGEGTSGGDWAAHLRTVPITSGTASAAPSVAGTGTSSATADMGEAALVRLRVSASTNLVIGESNVGVHSDNVVLVPNLVIGAANIAVHADNVGLSLPGTDLVIGAANVGVHSDNVVLSPNLVIGAANIAVHSDNVALIPNLVIGQANVAVHADNVTLGLPGTDLVIGESNIGVHSDNLILTASVPLVIGEANVGVHSDNVILIPNLIIGEANLGTHADNVVLEAFAPSGVYSITPAGSLLLTNEWQTVPLDGYSWSNSSGILSRISGRVRIRKTTKDTMKGWIEAEAYVDGVLALRGGVLWPHAWMEGSTPTYVWFDLSRIGEDDDVWYATDGDHTFSVRARMVTNKRPSGMYLDIELVGQSMEVT